MLSLSMRYLHCLGRVGKSMRGKQTTARSLSTLSAACSEPKLSFIRGTAWRGKLGSVGFAAGYLRMNSFGIITPSPLLPVSLYCSIFLFLSVVLLSLLCWLFLFLYSAAPPVSLPTEWRVRSRLSSTECIRHHFSLSFLVSLPTEWRLRSSLFLFVGFISLS
jgi:hypothetical protein